MSYDPKQRDPKRKPPQKDPDNKKRTKSILTMVVVALVFTVIVNLVYTAISNSLLQKITFSEFEDMKDSQQLAEVELSYGNDVYAVVPLVALNDVAISESMLMERDVKEFLGSVQVKAALIGVILVVLLVLFWKLTVGRRRYRYGKSVRGRSNYRGRKK